MVGVGIIISSAYAANELYQVNLKHEALIQDSKGMTEYEVCQFALKEYGMKMVEDMGCLNPIPDSALVNESTPI